MPAVAHLRLRALAVAAAIAGCGPAAAQGYSWNWVTIANPNWDISLTDYGYSDYLLDHTPGYVGREYLSGEWGAAVGYQRNGLKVAPTWLEPRFSYPDWDTNSNYSASQPMALGALTAQGLPTMQSVVGDGAIRITQDARFVDTLTGVAMGNVRASAGGAGASITSDRYVLQQTYTFQNQSGTTLENVQLFQFLHGLNSQSGVYDSRTYAGPMSEYRYDVTLGGDAGSGGGQYDYIALHSKVAPSAFELGAYGTEGIDSHSVGKPTTGTHLSVEANALSNADSYAPAVRWVAGAARYELGSLAPGASVSFDVLLTIRSGWQVGGGDGGSVGGSGGSPGSVNYQFLGSHDAGQFFVEFENEDAADVAQKIALGEFGTPIFGTPGSRLPLFGLEYDGSFSGALKLTFFIDLNALPPGIDLATLHLFHWQNGAWRDLGGGLDPATGGITVVIDSLSPFAVGVVPEPSAFALLAGGLALLAWRVRRRA